MNVNSYKDLNLIKYTAALSFLIFFNYFLWSINSWEIVKSINFLLLLSVFFYFFIYKKYNDYWFLKIIIILLLLIFFEVSPNKEDRPRPKPFFNRFSIIMLRFPIYFLALKILLQN